jgi:hypothetical protein
MAYDCAMSLMVKIWRVYFKKKQLQQYFITTCSIIICLLTWALDVVFSFEIHANSKKKKFFFVLISSLLPTSIYLEYQLQHVHYSEVNTQMLLNSHLLSTR